MRDRDRSRTADRERSRSRVRSRDGESESERDRENNDVEISVNVMTVPPGMSVEEFIADLTSDEEADDGVESDHETGGNANVTNNMAYKQMPDTERAALYNDAIKMVKGGASQRQASNFYNIKRTTLQHALKRGFYVGTGTSRKPTLTEQEEQAIEDHIEERRKIGCGVTASQLRRIIQRVIKVS